jgi:hypothetical protein
MTILETAEKVGIHIPTLCRREGHPGQHAEHHAILRDSAWSRGGGCFRSK